MKAITFVVVGFFLSALVPKAFAAEYIQFEEIEEAIRTKNPLVESSKERVDAKKYREGALGRSFLPEISAEVSQEAFKLGTSEQKTQPAWKIESNINLFRGGSDFAEAKVRKLETRVAIENQSLVTKDQLQKAYELYWGLSYKLDVKNTLETHLSLSQKNLSEANRRIGSGVATSTDRLEFQMKISLIKQEIAVVEKDIRRLAKMLAIALGKTGDVLPKGSIQHFHDWEKRILEVNPSTFPEIKLTKNEIEIDEEKKNQFRGNYLPSIDMYAGFSEPNQRDERDVPIAEERKESYFGIKASWSLNKAINSGIERGSLQKELNAKNKHLDYLSKQAEVSQQSYMDELKTLHSFVHDSEENIKVSYTYLEATLKEYSRGVKNSPDVLAATEKYIDSKIRLAEIVRDFNVLFSSQLALRNL